VSTHRSEDDRVVTEAASWALALRQSADSPQAAESLPIVELADRVRAIPLFASLSIDELFRIAEAGQETRHPSGRDLCHAGAAADDVLFLLDGRVHLAGATGHSNELAAPSVLGFEEVLQGTAFRSTVRTIDPLLCFRIAAGDFMTMVSDNMLLAQSLFTLLLATEAPRMPFVPAGRTWGVDDRATLVPADAARVLRWDPLLARATASQLMALSATAPEVALKMGTVLFDAGTAPSIFLILQGEVLLECAGRDAMAAPAGATIGVADTLAGVNSGWRATVMREGRALRIDRDDLFVLLADHIDLMQGLFSGAIAFRDMLPVARNEALNPGRQPASLA
jgi:CRP-like cAMP-binding protein